MDIPGARRKRYRLDVEIRLAGGTETAPTNIEFDEDEIEVRQGQVSRNNEANPKLPQLRIVVVDNVPAQPDVPIQLESPGGHDLRLPTLDDTEDEY